MERDSYAQRRPYVVPASLEDLKGPTRGVVELPNRLAWSGRKSYDLSFPADVTVMYERVLEESLDVTDIQRLLSADLLNSHWHSMFLPSRVRELWETRFPELSAAA